MLHCAVLGSRFSEVLEFEALRDLGGSRKPHLPVSQHSVKWKPGEGRRHLLTEGALPRALPLWGDAGWQGPVGRAATPQGGRSACPWGHLPSSAPTLQTEQREIVNTNVDPSKQARASNQPSCSLRSSQSGDKNVALSIPQGSFIFPFHGWNSMLHSDWPTMTSLSPGLLRQSICPGTLLSQFL